MTRDELRKEFEKWAEESYGFNAQKFFGRSVAPFDEEYQYADVQQAWKAAEWFYELGARRRVRPRKQHGHELKPGTER